MVNIKRGKSRLTVSTGAYNAFYKCAGWKVVADSQVIETTSKNPPSQTKAPEPKEVVAEDTDPVTDDADDELGEVESEATESDEELLEMPVSEMNKYQLKRAADLIGFDYRAAGINKTKDLRKAMKEKLKNREV